MLRLTHAAALLALAPLALPAAAAPADEAAATVATILDRFNKGDIEAFATAHMPDAVIVDEFAPYQWRGDGAVQRWLGDYAKDAARRGISGGRVEHGRPLQASSDGTAAYVVVPSTYCFMQNGKAMAADGSMSFVMTRSGAEWKIAHWTYAAPAPKLSYGAKQGKCGKAK